MFSGAHKLSEYGGTDWFLPMLALDDHWDGSGGGGQEVPMAKEIYSSIGGAPEMSGGDVEGGEERTADVFIEGAFGDVRVTMNLVKVRHCGCLETV
jgi:hypothetical protein